MNLSLYLPNGSDPRLITLLGLGEGFFSILDVRSEREDGVVSKACLDQSGHALIALSYRQFDPSV